MLMIRLSRIGRKKHPHYRLVIAEKARDPYGRTLEILGHYHPLQEDDKDKIVLHKERILHWISNGAQTSNTVNNLLINAGVIKADKKRTIGKYKSKKAQEESKKEKKSDEKADAHKSENKPTEDKKEGGDEKPTEVAKPEEVKKETPKTEEKPAEKEETPAAKEEAKA